MPLGCPGIFAGGNGLNKRLHASVAAIASSVDGCKPLPHRHRQTARHSGGMCQTTPAPVPSPLAYARAADLNLDNKPGIDGVVRGSILPRGATMHPWRRLVAWLTLVSFVSWPWVFAVLFFSSTLPSRIRIHHVEAHSRHPPCWSVCRFWSVRHRSCATNPRCPAMRAWKQATGVLWSLLHGPTSTLASRVHVGWVWLTSRLPCSSSTLLPVCRHLQPR
jgi:hypothetical protein